MTAPAKPLVPARQKTIIASDGVGALRKVAGGAGWSVLVRRAHSAANSAVPVDLVALVVDDGHQVETGPPDPVAERAAVQVDPLPLEDLGLPIKWQVVTELRDDNLGDEEFRGQPAGHDMFRRMCLRHGLRAAAAGVFGPPRDQHPELGGDHVQ